jgi:uncharacterized membrane protein
MTNDPSHRGKRPINALAGPYGHPIHPILVTVPIGAWIASVVFDIASHIADHPGFLTQASEWLIAIGILGALAAAVVGLLDLLAIPTGTTALRIALVHMSLNLAVTIAYVINFVWRHGAYTGGRPVAVGSLVLSIVSLSVLAVSGYLGGMLAYRYGIRVADEQTQAEGFISPESRRRHAGSTLTSG